MIKITSKSQQDEIIQELFSQVTQQSSLYIELESLPYFLSSVPSLKIFLFKTQNYPRQIFWYSYSNDILNFLYKNNVKVEFPYNSNNAITFTPSTPPTVINVNRSKKQDSTEVNYFEKLSQLKSRTSDKQDYTDNFNQYLSKNNEKIDFKQDLDSWLEKIENTKESLTKFKNDVIAEKKSKSNFWESLIELKWLYRSALSLFIITFVTLSIIYFPTNVYKIEIAPSLKQESVDLQFPETVFTKNRFTIKTNDDIESSGEREVTTDQNRSIGTVTLVNTSPTPINFKREGVVLISEENGFEYRQNSTDKAADIFTVPAKNNLSNQPMDIEIQALLPGEQFNLPINSTFRVYNIRGEAFGGAVKAIATSTVSNKLPNKDKIVSENDLSLLRSKAEEGLNNLKLQKLDLLKEKGDIINNNWVKEIKPSDYIFSNKLGEVSPKVSVEAQTEIEVYSIANDKLKEAIFAQLKIDNLSDLQIIETRIEEGQVFAKLFLSSKQNPEIKKNDVIGNLANINLDEGTLNIQQKYPNIKKVSKDFSGIKLPLISPRSKVEVNELNIN
jgi:hypothetical protein